MLEVRLLDETDAEAYRELRLEALRDEPLAFGSSYEESVSNSLEQWQKRIRSQEEGDFTVGAFEGQRLVGVASFFRNERVKLRHSGSVVGVYVTPTARGRGVSRRLMETMIARLRTYPDLEQITLAVSHTQEAAKKLYRSLGFEVWGHEKHALKMGDAYTDFEHMVLWL